MQYKGQDEECTTLAADMALLDQRPNPASPHEEQSLVFSTSVVYIYYIRVERFPFLKSLKSTRVNRWSQQIARWPESGAVEGMVKCHQQMMRCWWCHRQPTPTFMKLDLCINKILLILIMLGHKLLCNKTNFSSFSNYIRKSLLLI